MWCRLNCSSDDNYQSLTNAIKLPSASLVRFCPSTFIIQSELSQAGLQLAVSCAEVGSTGDSVASGTEVGDEVANGVAVEATRVGRSVGARVAGVGQAVKASAVVSKKISVYESFATFPLHTTILKRCLSWFGSRCNPQSIEIR